ncbi:MAG TPA: hypothetical protein PLL64_02365 [Rhodothermales bacterium]|nr:hypothetical protein [Bacteroidota bacterium]HRK73091.1 hypothetical protein [Rhodothermales bacterium]HRR09209.1 hypothetical protein [Rhodothermales bacterium]
MKQQTILGATLLFSVFGFLAAIDHEAGWLLVILSLVFGGVGIVVLQALLSKYNEIVRGNPDVGQGAVRQGLAFFVPFAVLAIVSDVVLGWHAAQVFFSAGLSAIGASCGAYLMAKGASKIGGFVVPMAWAFCGSAFWMMMTVALS